MLKNKLQSINSVVQGLEDGGCKAFFNFPGFKSHLIFEGLGGTQISINERNAYDLAYGSSLGGNRAVVTFKNVGLNVAADSFLNSIISGVNAGLVIVVTDDTHVSDSQSLMDSRHYVEFYGGLWFEPSTIQEAYNTCRESFELSEKFDVPVVIRLTSDYFALSESYKRKSTKRKRFSLVHAPEKFLVHPYYWKKQISRLKKKNDQIKSYVESKNVFPEKKHKNGLIILGPHNKTFKDVDVFSISTYPLPQEKIKKFINVHKRIRIMEHGDEYALNKTKGINNDSNIESLKPSYPDLSKTYRTWTGLEKLFISIKKLKPKFVISDLTQFTNESIQIIDSCLCLGSSVGVASGVASTGIFPICVTGDTSFLHGGLDALQECISRKIKMLLIVIDNGGSWCTGNQRTILDVSEVIKKLQIEYDVIDYSRTNKNEFVLKIGKYFKQNKLSCLVVKSNSKIL